MRQFPCQLLETQEVRGLSQLGKAFPAAKDLSTDFPPCRVQGCRFGNDEFASHPAAWFVPTVVYYLPVPHLFISMDILYRYAFMYYIQKEPVMTIAAC
jgi:hypothetical protein